MRISDWRFRRVLFRSSSCGSIVEAQFFTTRSAATREFLDLPYHAVVNCVGTGREAQPRSLREAVDVVHDGFECRQEARDGMYAIADRYEIEAAVGQRRPHLGRRLFGWRNEAHRQTKPHVLKPFDLAVEACENLLRDRK